MNLQVQPQDLQNVLSGMGAIQNPRGTALSMLGFTPENQRTGVPVWAWGVLALGVGIYIGGKFSPKLKGIFQ
jgi:hypothetical protein